LGDLKSFFSPALIRRLAGDIARVHPDFPSQRFVNDASAGLENLELLDRGKQIGRALATHLPPSYPDAVDVIVRSLGPEHESDELLGAGMAPFFYYPHLQVVIDHGLDHFDLSMQAQYELTKRFSAEASIRPFIAKDPERTFAVLRRWSSDPNPHVRRLVSEGTRLRLPWAMRVPWLDAHPERIVELLELLKDDPATLVRRSVANNLNDMGKARPRMLVDIATRWLKGASAERRALIEHALRGAVKRGDQQALKLLGFGTRPAVATENVRFTPKRVAIPGRVIVNFDIRSRGREPQDLLVDLIVHFVKASGKRSAKVFKLKRVTLQPKQVASLSSSVSLAVHTTRKPQPGRHEVEVAINGSVSPLGDFVVTRPRGRLSNRSNDGHTARPHRTRSGRAATARR
jgi:3-methyladenine DNA glycosylase AlkC